MTQNDDDPEGWAATSRSMLAILISMVGFTINDAFMKAVTETLPLGEAIFVRSLFALFVVILLGRPFGRLRIDRTCLCAPVVLRNVMEIAATVCYLTALLHLPLANLAAILQAIPLAVTAGGALFMGMVVGWRRWAAIFVGFLGVILVIDPRVGEFNAWSLLGVATVLFAATRDLATRRVPIEISSRTLMVLILVLVAISGLTMGLFETWRTPTGGEFARLLAAGLLIIAAQGGIVVAMRTGNFAAAAPMRYSGVLWALVIGYLVWGDIPKPLMLIGTAIIITSGVYAYWRERRLAGKPQPASD